MEEKDRIDKLIANKFNISRQEAAFLIETGKINIGKRIFSKPHSKITLYELAKINLEKEEIEKYKIEQKEEEKLIKEEISNKQNLNTKNKKNQKNKDNKDNKKDDKDRENKENEEELNLHKELEVLYEDKDSLVINKPKDLVVYSGVGKEEVSVVSILKEKYPLSDLYGEERLGIVHRLDKDTSGVLLIAKNNEAHKYYEKLFKDRKIEKKYIALVKGNIPETKGKIDMPISRSSSDFKKMEANKEGKEAVTYFTVIERFKKYTLVEIDLETGRTHQIRVHFAQIGYPVVGDRKYSNGKNSFNVDSQLLHAQSLKFINTENKEIEIKKEIPEEFKSVLKILKNQ